MIWYSAVLQTDAMAKTAPRGLLLTLAPVAMALQSQLARSRRRIPKIDLHSDAGHRDCHYSVEWGALLEE